MRILTEMFVTDRCPPPSYWYYLSVQSTNQTLDTSTILFLRCSRRLRKCFWNILGIKAFSRLFVVPEILFSFSCHFNIQKLKGYHLSRKYGICLLKSVPNFPCSDELPVFWLFRGSTCCFGVLHVASGLKYSFGVQHVVWGFYIVVV
jgi:hypothetical protein